MKILFLILIHLKLIFSKSLTPLSQCTQGRITSYGTYQNGGACGFGIPKIYGAAPNEAFYNNGDKCGICYELVTPNGVLYFMVDDKCPVVGNEAACSGDMLHFDLHKNGFDSVINDKTLGKLNITFRMVACNHEGNIILKTKSEVVVMNHTIGLKKVYYSLDNENWNGLEREGDYNHWTIPTKPVTLPLYIKFESISGEKVQTKIEEIKSNYFHDTGVQFTVPNNMYFDVSTLEKIIGGAEKEECCKLDDAFTLIYDEGKFLGEWKDTSNCESDIENTENCKEGSNKCIKVNLVDWKVFQFYNRIQPETKRYNAIEFYVRSESECNNCIYIKSGEKPAKIMSITSAGVWERKEVLLSDLGITEEKFRNILFQGSKADSQIFYFDKIKLVKSSFIDTGSCYEIKENEENKENKESESKTEIPTGEVNDDNENKSKFTLINSYLNYLLIAIFIMI